ncbi:FecR domain-containing protein [Paucibacter sediminis]|uniref:FecR domain-containing protein n=1 Tax=Paucibacter sediminis TaxID=3019553 RepID=A0AA95NNN0_9BURK|nr:FecR domain-containing protein [Paucibacter sp. S2-9]WIT13316.1 FecR domain-containing protein [Paucibacter sp. S2-9]
MSSELTSIEARAAGWIAERDRAGSAWPAERQAALEAWLNAATAHRVAWLRLDQAWRRADRLRALQAAPSPVSSRPSPRPWWQQQRRAIGGALAGLGLLALVLAVQVVAPLRGNDAQSYATARGQREAVALADGSRLTLNTATKLRTAVTAKQREVWLEQGEAFFDIAHDASRPFVVHAGRQTVTVLGTKFSLLREGERLRVAVLEGRVQVQAEQSRPAVLVRDDTAVAEASNVLVSRQTSQQVNAALSWLQGKLVFDQVSLAEAASQFNRYNRKQLVITDAAAARIGIGGVFDANNAEAFARLLHAGFGLQVQVSEEEIRVSSASAS